MPKQGYTAEFKEQAVKHAQAVGIVVAAKELGLSDRGGIARTKANCLRICEGGPIAVVPPLNPDVAIIRATTAATGATWRCMSRIC